jgi:hypothetical protein
MDFEVSVAACMIMHSVKIEDVEGGEGECGLDHTLRNII